MEKNKPLKLATSNFWTEIRGSGIPDDLADALVSLVSSHISNAIPPEAKPRLIVSAKKYLQQGILLSESFGDNLYDVVVFVPDPPNENCVPVSV